jgi:hypothetical protein
MDSLLVPDISIISATFSSTFNRQFVEEKLNVQRILDREEVPAEAKDLPRDLNYGDDVCARAESSVGQASQLSVSSGYADARAMTAIF